MALVSLVVATSICGVALAAVADPSQTNLAATSSASPADSVAESATESWLKTKIDLQLFTHRCDSISNVAAAASLDELKSVESAIKREGLKWELYYPTIKDQIASNEELLSLVSAYTQQSVAMSDSLSWRKDYFTQLETFSENEAFIIGEDSLYRDMVTQAKELSLTKVSATLLEKLQGSETLRFAEIDNRYNKANEIAKSYGELQSRMDSLGSHYISIQQQQAVIQEAKYTPFLQSIKEYIYGLAAVAMILTFVNMLTTKYSAAKKMAKQAKEMKKMMGANNNDYPTI